MTLACLLALRQVLLAQTSASAPADLRQFNWHLTARPWTPSNFNRTNLLDRVENIVNALAPLQYWNNADPGDVSDGGDVQNGSIIDPFELKEWQYATPYYSFAVATAVANGRSTNLCEIGARALDHATADIAGLDGTAQANDSHGEFFGPPMMKALRIFKQIQSQYPSILTSNRIARWETRLHTSRASYMNGTVHQNWETYGMKGEWLRVQDGLVPRSSDSAQGVSWIEGRWFAYQRDHYVRDRDVLGLNPYFLSYHDGDPGPKQNFAYMGGATGNLLDMIYNGYDGASAAEIKSFTRFCARSCLLFVSGNGDAPAGGRTGDHVWNDVVWGNMFELAAEMAWADGDARLAGQFRHAARVAFKSSWRFQQEQGWFSVTKSLIHPAHQNFYADWSALCNYNGYTEIHSSEAFVTEPSDIPEQPSPAEVGGFVASLDDEFDNTFVNAGGMQAQICTEGSIAANVTGSLRWYALGITRFSRPGWESRLGPGDGWIKADGTSAISFAPTFLETNNWTLMAQQPDRFIGVFTPTFVNPVLVRGTLNLTPKSGATGPSFALNLTVTPDGVLVDTSRTAGTNSFGLTWPLMIYDGKHVLVTNVTPFIASTAYPKMSATKTTLQAENVTLAGGVTTATSGPGYTGTSYAVFPASGGSITWSNVPGGDGGAATIGFRYTLNSATATSRAVTLLVNGTPFTANFEHTGTSNTYNSGVLSFPMVWHQLHLPVTLLAGANNTIQLQAGTAGGLNIDEMRVFPADAAQAEPDQQNFISLDATPTIDMTTAVRRTAYGDQLPIRVANADNTIATFVYPRTASDPSAESVRTSFVRSGTNFSSSLERVTNNLYIGRWSAGGEGSAIDLNNDGTNDVSFSTNCGFVLQTTNSLVTALEADRFVTANYRARQLRLAPYTPINWSDSATLWQNLAVPATGNHFEVTANFTPAATNGDVRLGFSGTGVTDAASLIAGLRFGPDDRVTPLAGAGLNELFYPAGITNRIRAQFDLVTRQYSLWVKPGSGAEVQIVSNATLPVSVTNAANVGTFAWFADATAVSDLAVTQLPELSVAIISPTVPSIALPGTNVTLVLSGVVSNASGFVPTAWASASSAGAVTFGNSNALTTTAQFSSLGNYTLTLTATGTTASAAQNVFVTGIVTNGLQAWWKMDEAGSPATLADSSGNGRNATNTSGTMTTGYISNAVQFTSTSARATWPCANSNQVTVAAWVRCDTTGGGSFPRIVDTPAYRMIFRFSSSDVNSVGFATFDTTNGDWDSGAGSISLGTWYHVAATYDRGTLTTPPIFYINGVKRNTTTLTSPSGAAPSLGGVGYIGNNAALTRWWNGLIDDLRIYNRVLTAGEIIAIATTNAPANLPPVVNAGANQTTVVGLPANLTGSASDDGQPNPPAAFTTTWTQVSGPSATTFGNANALATTASFSAAGNYVLQLTANDGQIATASSVNITAVARPIISALKTSSTLQLSWPNDGLAWRLQSQTNTLATNLWFDVSSVTNPMNVTIDTTNAVVFYRLVYP
ncbi:MAG: hypothetical protein EPO07_15715 [Verrucomicrobia bacterium]|nr:MAG: hypothetical protein EPO07_15715 [Verrucomicrobiota bacterium]